MAIGESKQLSDSERAAAYAASERGARMIRVSSDSGGGAGSYTLITAYNYATISTGITLAALQTFGRVVHPKLS